MTRKRIVVSSINIFVSLGIIFSLFLSIAFFGTFGSENAIEFVIGCWKTFFEGRSEFSLLWFLGMFLLDVYLSVFLLSVIVGAICCIVHEIRNLKKNSSEYTISFLCFGIPALISLLGVAEYIGYAWIVHLIIRGILSIFLGQGVVLRFFGTGIFLLPALIIFHLVFNHYMDDEKEEKTKPKGNSEEQENELQENLETVLGDNTSLLTESEKQYAEKQEKLREEILGNISLKDGYKFASVPGRIFAEKTDVPGSYCCPYCYAEVSSDVSSMCGNCGKSLGVS